MAGEPRPSVAPAPGVMVGGEPMLPTRTIADNAANSADHTTLVAAVSAAGLVDTLKGEGPFTVFAPVDSAFAALPPGTLDSLMQPENRAMLTSVLTYHVVPGKVMAGDVKAGPLKSVEGSAITVAANGNTVMVDNATVTKTDIAADNGVIHVIDSVILPKK